MLKRWWFWVALVSLWVLSGCDGLGDGQYTVVFHPNNGEDVFEVVLGESDAQALVIPDYAGHEFVGWYDNEAFEGETYQDASDVQGDITLYAKWIVSEPVMYSLTFLDEDGAVLSTHGVEEGTSLEGIPVPEVTVQEGYTFAGWDPLLPAVMPSEDLVLTTVYEIIPYDIAYIVSGASLEDRAYNVLLWSGIELACDANELRCQYYIPDSMGITDIIDTIDLAASEGAGLIIVQGYEFDHAMYVSQNDHPDVQFLLFESVPISQDFSDFTIQANTLPVSFPYHEMGFLAGYSLVVEGYTSLAFLSGMPTGMIQQHAMGFVYGAYYAANELGVDLTLPADAIAFYGNFEPSPGVVEMARDFYNSGAEVVYCPVSPLCDSVAVAADQTGNAFLSAEMGSYESHASYLGSVGIRYDVIAQLLIEEYLTDTLEGGMSRTFGVSEGMLALYYLDPEVFDATLSASIMARINIGSVMVPHDADTFANLMVSLPNTGGLDVPQVDDIVIH